MSGNRSLIALGLALQLAGCTARINGDEARPGGAPTPGGLGGGGGGGPSVNGKTCANAPLLPTRIWRLTSAQYRESARDLLLLDKAPDVELEAEPVVEGFKNDADALSVSTHFAGQLQKAGEALGADGLRQFAHYSGCAAEALADQACVQKFIQGFGTRAFRRPLTGEEATAYLGVYQAGVEDNKAPGGVLLLVQTMLQSPYFLYRSELGAATDKSAGATKLEAYELASDLSYSLWGTPPDDALLASASSGKLTTTPELETQTRRLLGDARAGALISEFAAQWLELQDPSTPLRDAATFPEFAAVKADMFSEFAALSREAFLGPGATLGGIFASSSTIVSPSLATYYGLPAVTGASPGKAPLAGTARAGLLTSGALVASWSRDKDTAPMSRGRKLLERVLCQALPPPPPSLDVPPIPKLDNATTREQYVIHAQNPTCTGCHDTLDSVAFALEEFDSAGHYRTTENGKPIDASGQVQNAGDASGPFSNMAELATRLSGSSYARACLARNYVRFAGGRAKHDEDSCLVDGLVDAARAHGDSPSELVVALVTSDFFRSRQRL